MGGITNLKKSRSDKSIVIFAVLFLTLTGIKTIHAQDLETTLKSLSEAAAKSYVKPVVDGFGANLNGGWYHKAPKAKLFGFDLEFGIVAMGTFIPDADRTFSTSGPFRFTRAQAEELAAGVNPLAFDDVVNAILSREFTVGISGPTAIGSETDNIRVDFSGTTILGEIIPSKVFELTGVTGLLGNVDIIPLGAPQLSIGTVFGSQFTFRYLPSMEIDEDIGEIKYFGFGVQHNPSLWLGLYFPFDVSVGYFTQTLDVGTILKTTATAYGVNASKQFGGRFLNFTPYAGYMWESSEMDFSYDYDIETPTGPSKQSIAFKSEGVNQTRLTLGISLKFAAFNLNADYNFGTVNSVTGGLMIGF